MKSWLNILPFFVLLLRACSAPETPMRTPAPLETTGIPAVQPAPTMELQAPVKLPDPSTSTVPPASETPIPPSAIAPAGQATPKNGITEQGNVFIEQKQLVILKSNPPQQALSLTGYLPTPCHQLKVEVGKPDEQHNILVKVYSLTSPGEICAQVLNPFETSIPLGQLPAGRYKVFLNGEVVGEVNY